MKNLIELTTDGTAYNDLQLVYEILNLLGEDRSFNSDDIFIAINELFPHFGNVEKVVLALKTLKLIDLFKEV